MAIINKLPPDSFSFPVSTSKPPTEWKLIVPKNTNLHPFHYPYPRDIIFQGGQFMVWDGSNYRYATNPTDLSDMWQIILTGENTELDYDNWSGLIIPCAFFKNNFYSFLANGYDYCTDEDGYNVDYGYQALGTAAWYPANATGISDTASCSCIWKDKLYVFDTMYCWYSSNPSYSMTQVYNAGGHCVATSDDIMVVGMGAGIRYSTNGTSFTSKTFSSMGITGVSNLRGLTYGNGVFVGINKGTNVAVISNDGMNWQKITLPFKDTSVGRQYELPLAFGNGYFVYVGGKNNCAYSKDGINWTTFTMDNISSIFTACDIAYGNGRFVVVTNGSNIALECEF